MGSEEKVPRRGVLNILLGGSLVALVVAALYPVVRYLIPPRVSEATLSSVLAGKASELQPNQGKIFKFGRKPGILIRTPDGDFRAFIAICTHLDCTVQYRQDWQLIWCACHNGRYDLNGINIAGPPPRPLTPLTVNIMGDEVYVSPQG
jgi:cytochrome b6-f complex iron-sulfur subunit